MNIRVEDLPLIPSFSTGVLLYASNNGVPYSMNLQNFTSGISGVISPLVVYTTGTQTIGGSKSFLNPIPDTSSVGSIDPNIRILYDTSNQTSLNWSLRQNFDSLNTISIDYGNRKLYYQNGNIAVNWSTSAVLNDLSNPATTSVDWGNRLLYHSNSNSTIDWEGCLLRDFNGFLSINWESRILNDSNFTAAIAWMSRTTIDALGFVSSDWTNRYLYDTGTNISLDWQNRILSGNWNVSGGLKVNGATLLTSIDSGNILSVIQGLSGVLTGINTSIIEGYKILRTPNISFKNTGINYVYTIPNNYIFNIDSMEVITNFTGGHIGSLPYIGFGNSGNLSGYMLQFVTNSQQPLNRDIRNNPSDGISGGITLAATIFSGITGPGGANQSGFLIFKGYLIKNQ